MTIAGDGLKRLMFIPLTSLGCLQPYRRNAPGSKHDYRVLVCFRRGARGHGIAGGCSLLHGFARVAGYERLSKTALYVGTAADVVSPALLISDLGRPERFLNMLRVLKVTSPMS